VIFKPKEHYLLEVTFSCFEKTVEIEYLGKFDNLKNLTWLFDWVQHIQVIEIEIVDDLAESFIIDLTFEVNHNLLIILGLLGDSFLEYLLKVVWFSGDDSDVGIDVLVAWDSWFFFPERFFLGIKS